MAGRHLPDDPSKGDPNTIGGYQAVHDRPAAFEGSDGFSYSVELCTDATGERERPIGAYFFFLKWKRLGEQGIAGHLESEFLAWGIDVDAAVAALGGFALTDVRAELEHLIAEHPVEVDRPGRWFPVRPAGGAEP